MSKDIKDNKSVRGDSSYSSIIKVTVVGAVLNLVLSILKVIAGIVGNSSAVVADGIHSLSDLVTDAVVIIGAGFWSQPPDRRHPHGHGKIENLVSVIIGLLLLIAGAATGYKAVENIRFESALPPGLLPLVAAIASIISKEILYRWTKEKASVINSPALSANAWHHRADALSSIPAALAVGTSILFPELSYLDFAGAIVVSLFILQAGYKITREGLEQLTDHAAQPELIECVENIVRNTEGVLGCHAVRSRLSGGEVHVDLHVQVDGDLTVREGHKIAGFVKKRVLQKCGNVNDILVHLEDGDSND